MPKFTQILFFTMTGLMLTGCSKELESIQIASTQLSQDPTTLIEGTTLVKTSSFTLANMANYDNMSYSSAIGHYSEKTTGEQNNFVDDDRTNLYPELMDFAYSSADSDYSFSSYTPADTTAFPGDYYAYKESSGEYLSFIFEKETGVDEFKLIAMEKGGNLYTDFETLHYSVKPDDSVWTLLLYFDTPTMKLLVSTHFTTIVVDDISDIAHSTGYEFLIEGYKARWPISTTINIDVCTAENDTFNQAVKAKIEEWNPHFGGNLTINTSILSDYPPYSDVNSHCHYVTNNYRFDLEQAGTLGVAYITFNHSERHIIDSDVFYFKQEFNIYNIPMWPSSPTFNRVVIHEHGHAIGLHHQFTGTPSVMSYDNFMNSTLQTYDIQAIGELYTP